VLSEQHVRSLLASRVGSPVEMVFEDGAWAAFIPGLPIATEAASPDEAVDELILALREYAEDWHDHPGRAPNHAENGPLVELIGISDDDQLRAWAVGG
jgi:predicted RNase H-like HicB family nuclease